MKGFSIIICCYNSADVLPRTLEHLAGLKIPQGYKVEVILVNNLSTDQTADLARTIWHALTPPFVLKVVKENRPGLSFARRKGIGCASYDLLLFCDDDNRLAPEYLLIASEILARRERIGILGGLGVPDYESLPDYWPEDLFIYGSGPQAAVSGPAPYVHGAGVVLRKSVFQVIENADFRFLLTDRKGDELTSGGDYELCYAIALAGYDIWYEKTLVFDHYITSERMTYAYCKRFIRESAPSMDVLDVYRYYIAHAGFKVVPFYLKQFRLIIYHLYHLCLSFRARKKFSDNKKICFLEYLHMQFHRARIKCIGESIFKYVKWSKELKSFKKRLAAL